MVLERHARPQGRGHKRRSAVGWAEFDGPTGDVVLALDIWLDQEPRSRLRSFPLFDAIARRCVAIRCDILEQRLWQGVEHIARSRDRHRYAARKIYIRLVAGLSLLDGFNEGGELATVQR